MLRPLAAKPMVCEEIVPEEEALRLNAEIVMIENVGFPGSWCFGPLIVEDG